MEYYMMESKLPEELTREYLGTIRKKIRGVSLKIEKENDLIHLSELLKIKKKTKVI